MGTGIVVLAVFRGMVRVDERAPQSGQDMAMKPGGPDATGLKADKENAGADEKQDSPEANVKDCQQDKGKDAGINEEKSWLALRLAPAVHVFGQQAFPRVRHGHRNTAG